MVQNVFIVVSFLMNEHVDDEAGKMFSELDQVENLHAQCGFRNGGYPVNNVQTSPMTSQPGGEETCILD